VEILLKFLAKKRIADIKARYLQQEKENRDQTIDKN